MDVAEEELQGLYTWVDEIPLSRPKRNIARDFSDGVLLAEVVAHFYPRMVQLHNYSSANAMQQKMYNWNTLNQKVFRKLGFQLSKQDCLDIGNSVPGAVERVLKLVRIKLAAYTGEPSSLASPGQLVHSDNLSSSSSPGASALSALRPQSSNKAYSPAAAVQQGIGSVGHDLVAEQEHTIRELRETSGLLETKVRKLEQLVKLKDAKIQTLMAKLQAAGLV